MKKTILSLSLLLSAAALSAQTLIKASFQKDDAAVYETVYDINLATMVGSQQAKQTTTTRYVVKEAGPNGYQLERTITSIKKEGTTEILSQTTDGTSEYLLNIPMILQTDANGKIQKIVNYEEVVTKASQAAIKSIDSLYKAMPVLSQNLPKEKMIMTTSEQLEEKNIIKNMTENSFLSFYGRTIKTGDTEKEELSQGIKVITTYDVANVLGTTAVVAKSKSNMNEKEVKQMMLENIKKMGMEDAASQFETIWGQLKAAGMANIDYKDTDTYHFQKSGWLNDQLFDGRLKMMGTDMTINIKTKLTQHSWK